jgi:hypothetical protein
MRAQYLLLIMLLAVGLPAVSLSANEQETSVCDGPTGSPPPPIVLEDDSDYANDDEVLQRRILRYLNTTGSIDGLRNAIEISAVNGYPFIHTNVISADFTGDSIKDVLVHITFSWGTSFDEFLSLFTCTDNAYQHLDTLQNSYWGSGDEDSPPTIILMAIDLNNNQWRDLLVQKTTIEGQKYHDLFSIYEWDDSMIATIFEIGPYYGAFHDIEVRNRDEDVTTLELNIGYYYSYQQETATAFVELTFTRPIDMLYAWDGETFAFECRHFSDEPGQRFAVLHSAETLRACGFYDQAATYYRRLWDDVEVLPWQNAAWLDYPESLPIED